VNVHPRRREVTNILSSEQILATASHFQVSVGCGDEPFRRPGNSDEFAPRMPVSILFPTLILSSPLSPSPNFYFTASSTPFSSYLFPHCRRRLLPLSFRRMPGKILPFQRRILGRPGGTASSIPAGVSTGLGNPKLCQARAGYPQRKNDPRCGCPDTHLHSRSLSATDISYTVEGPPPDPSGNGAPMAIAQTVIGRARGWDAKTNKGPATPNQSNSPQRTRDSCISDQTRQD